MDTISTVEALIEFLQTLPAGTRCGVRGGMGGCVTPIEIVQDDLMVSEQDATFATLKQHIGKAGFSKDGWINKGPAVIFYDV